MEDNIYLLRTDRPGKIVAKTAMQTVRKTLSSAILNHEAHFRALKGDLFEELPGEEQPTDEHKISLVSVEDETKVLEVATDDVVKLSAVEAGLLLAVPSSKKRSDLYFARDILKTAAALKKNDKVEVRLGRGMPTDGRIKFKGEIEGKRGTHFGVALDLPFGDNDGYHLGKRYFDARKKYGVFATVNMLKFPQGEKLSKYANGIDTKQKSTSKLAEKQSRIEDLGSYLGLKIGMRVATFVDDSKDKDKVLRGVIRFIGQERDKKEVLIGIELDTPDGASNGLYSGERLFKCEKNHAIFTQADSVIKEEDYKEDSKDYESYVVLVDEADKSATNEKNKEIKPNSLNWESTYDPLQNNDLKKYKRSESLTGPASNSTLISRTQALRKATDGAHSLDLEKKQIGDSFQRISEQNMGHQRELHDLASHGPRSMSFYENHYSEVKQRENGRKSPFYGSSPTLSEKPYYDPPSYGEGISAKIPSETEYQVSGSDFTRSQAPRNIDLTLQVDSVVEVSINSVPHYGVIRWMGVPDGFKTDEPIVGIELEQQSQFATDGSFKGKRYFNCSLGRGFFVKLSNCKKDARFPSFQSNVPQVSEQKIEELPGIYLPVEKIEDVPIGQMRGIQGHRNSCYLDSTLFAMFAFSVVFDVTLHRERRADDIRDYDEVQRVLKETIVNPLRSKGFVNAGSVLELRKWLDKLGAVQGFMDEEKDPEEFLMLLFRDVLKVDPFIRLRTDDDVIEKTYCYQIWVEKDEYNPLPSLQYLIEQSFLTGNLRLEEVPSVFIVQLPRFGMQKIYKRIRLNAELDISKVLSSATYNCLICEKKAKQYCRDCCHSFGFSHPMVYLCNDCTQTVHQHSDRRKHQPKLLRDTKLRIEDSPEDNTLELFAIICIKTSHYITFAKCGEEPDERWVFFDSMADRIGGQNGHNIPEVIECPEVKEWFNEKPLRFTESDTKNAPEKILRLFEDASLCLYRSKDLSIYR